LNRSAESAAPPKSASGCDFWAVLILGGAVLQHSGRRPAICWGFSRLRKNSLLQLSLGGAAVYRCDNCFVLIPALAAEAAALGQKRVFQQPAKTKPLDYLASIVQYPLATGFCKIEPGVQRPYERI
jgi:hypothetical protein